MLVFGPTRNALERTRANMNGLHSDAAGIAKPLLGMILSVMICLSCLSVLDAVVPDSNDGVQGRSDGTVRTMATTLLTFSASPSRVYVGDTVTFFANASSDIATSLDFTLFFDSLLPSMANNTASPVFTTTTGNPGSLVTTFAYDHVGNLSGTSGTYFRAKLYVGDGANTVNLAISVYVVENAAPTFDLTLPTNYDVSIGIQYNFTTVVADVDDDPLTVTWDFGDGSDLAVNTTGPAASGIAVTQSHVWSPELEPGVGDYFIYFYMNITLDDGLGHTTQFSTRISIYVPWNFSPDGSFWTDSSYVDPTDIVVLYADATDPEGDPLTWTYTFSNETETYHTEVYHTPATAANTTVWSNITHTFAVEGAYTVTLWLSDAVLLENQVFPHNLSKEVRLTSSENQIPGVLENITFYPQLIFFNASLGYASAQLSIQANDFDGDVLTVTWDFGDGTDQAVDYSPGGSTQVYEFVQMHDYGDSGAYNVSCSVTDGRPGHEIVRYGSLVIRSNNSAPDMMGLLLNLSNSNFAAVNSTVRLTIILNDAELDAIDVWWSFGDNSSIVLSNITEFDDEGNGTSEVSHVYSSLGSFTVQIWFTDNKFDDSWHNSSWNATVAVREAWVPESNLWDLWDYLGLGIVLCSFGAIVAFTVYMRSFRRKLDDKGMTYEEYKIKKKELKAARRKASKKGGTSGGK